MPYQAILRCCRHATATQVRLAERLFLQALERTLGPNIRACQDAFAAMMNLDESKVTRPQYAAAVSWLNACDDARTTALCSLRYPVGAYFDVQRVPQGFARA